MRILSILVCAGLLSVHLVGLAEPSQSIVQILVQKAQKPTPSPLHPSSPPKFNVSAYILLDVASGRVLAEYGADERFGVASLTKIMTAYIVADALSRGEASLDTLILVSESAWQKEGSSMFIEVGKEVRLEDLLRGVIVQSGNDASIALAEYFGSTEAGFTEIMNRYVERLGLRDTNFANSTGLTSAEGYSSARDMALLSWALIRDFPEIYSWHGIREYTFNGIKQYNRNRLLWRTGSGVDGIKTGYTSAAGYCLAVSAVRDGRRLISVVLGAESEAARTRVSESLLNYGYRFYETARIYGRGEGIDKIHVWKGHSGRISLGLRDDLYVTYPRGQRLGLEIEASVREQVIAPVGLGEELGKLRVSYGGEELAARRLVALEAVALGDWRRRLEDTIRLWLE